MFKSNKLKEILLLRAKAKAKFTVLTNDKKSTKKEILEAYKQFTKADQDLISLYEQKITKEKSYDKAA